MAKITPKDIEKVARLAMIELDQKKQQDLCTQISNILDWVDKLNEIDTSKVTPLTTVCESSLTLHNDIVNDGNIAQQVLKNANDPKYGYFSVPKVIE
jgi:aspartyl-tRNA(Asn)/glutamyl-tRNA(Gln) amidotransferase subunit C